MGTIVPQEIIENRIYLIRGRKIMLDMDLAQLYKVKTKVLNQAVKRNLKRFPEDFMFILTEKDKAEVVTNCDHLSKLKFSYQLPYAFTEHGVAMLSSVLNSERAIQVNIAIMRAFGKLREILSTHKELAHKLSELEHKIEKHDGEIQAIFEAIRQLMTPHLNRPSVGSGFIMNRPQTVDHRP